LEINRLNFFKSVPALIIIIIVMGWRARQGAWLFPRHSVRRNDRPHADMLYGGQSRVVWDQLRLFVAKTSVDDLLGGANPRGDDW